MKKPFGLNLGIPVVSDVEDEEGNDDDNDDDDDKFDATRRSSTFGSESSDSKSGSVYDTHAANLAADAAAQIQRERLERLLAGGTLATQRPENPAASNQQPAVQKPSGGLLARLGIASEDDVERAIARAHGDGGLRRPPPALLAVTASDSYAADDDPTPKSEASVQELEAANAAANQNASKAANAAGASERGTMRLRPRPANEFAVPALDVAAPGPQARHGSGSGKSKNKSKRMGGFSISENGTLDLRQFRIRKRGAITNDEFSELCEENLEFLSSLGAGASGRVSMCRVKATGTLCALKSVDVTEEGRLRQVMSEIEDHMASQGTAEDSPYFVRIYNVFHTDGVVHVAMEFMNRGSLQSIVDHHGPLHLNVLREIARQMVYGFIKLHGSRRIHRDIKPGNVLVNDRGEIKLADFGIAKNLDANKSHGGSEEDDKCNTFVGTTLYMSPERIESQQYGFPGDIWSFGLTLIHCAEGKLPLNTKGGYWAMMIQLAKEPAPSLGEQFDPDLRDFVSKCLQKDPNQRWTALQLAEHPFIKNAPGIRYTLPYWPSKLNMMTPEQYDVYEAEQKAKAAAKAAVLEAAEAAAKKSAIESVAETTLEANPTANAASAAPVPEAYRLHSAGLSVSPLRAVDENNELAPEESPKTGTKFASDQTSGGQDNQKEASTTSVFSGMSNIGSGFHLDLPSDSLHGDFRASTLATRIHTPTGSIARGNSHRRTPSASAFVALARCPEVDEDVPTQANPHSLKGITVPEHEGETSMDGSQLMSLLNISAPSTTSASSTAAATTNPPSSSSSMGVSSTGSSTLQLDDLLDLTAITARSRNKERGEDVFQRRFTILPNPPPVSLALSDSSPSPQAPQAPHVQSETRGTSSAVPAKLPGSASNGSVPAASESATLPAMQRPKSSRYLAQAKPLVSGSTAVAGSPQPPARPSAATSSTSSMLTPNRPKVSVESSALSPSTRSPAPLTAHSTKATGGLANTPGKSAMSPALRATADKLYNHVQLTQTPPSARVTPGAALTPNASMPRSTAATPVAVAAAAAAAAATAAASKIAEAAQAGEGIEEGQIVRTNRINRIASRRDEKSALLNSIDNVFNISTPTSVRSATSTTTASGAALTPSRPASVAHK